jgi:hypothetical protein
LRIPTVWVFVWSEGDSPATEVRIRLWDSPVQKTDTEDGQNTAGEESLRRIQETEYRIEKIKSLVYVV